MATAVRLDAVETDIIGLRSDLRQAMQGLEIQKVQFTDEVNHTFAQQKLIMGEIIDGARKEFDQLRNTMTGICRQTEHSLRVLGERIQKFEAQPNYSDKVKHGYLPQKHMTPKTFADKPEEWRQWQEDVEEYLDSINPGIKELLQEIDRETAEVDEEWREKKDTSYPDRVIRDQVQVWRAIKRLTEGEAKKIIMSVKDEDGFRAWQQLRLRFEPAVGSRQGMVLADFSGMVARPAKTPSELVTIIADFQRLKGHILHIVFFYESPFGAN